MPATTLDSVYAMAHSLADYLPDAVTAGRTGRAEACVKGMTEAATAVLADAGRVTENEERAARRLQVVLVRMNGKTTNPRTAGIVANMVKRWLGPNGLPLADLDEFERTTVTLQPHKDSFCPCASLKKG